MATAICAPAPRAIDQLAKDFDALKQKWLDAKLAATEAQEKLEQKKDELIALAREHGGAHAEKSRILYGVGWEIVATFGQTVQTDAAAVEKFREACADMRKAAFRKIFEEVVSYRLLSTAGEFVRTSKLTPKIKALYAACQVIKDKSPSLTVREKSAA